MLRLITLLLFTCLIFPSHADESPEKLVIGFIPNESEGSLKQHYNSLIKHIEQQLKIPVELKIPANYDVVIDEMKQKKIDIAYFGPKSYVEASEKAGAMAFARILSANGSEGYHSVIVTLKKSGLNTFADLKGKRWMYSDPQSTSGMLIPSMYFYLEARIEPEKYFSSVGFSGSHQKSIIALQNNEADAVAISENLLLRGESNWSINLADFTVVWRSELIPNAVLTYRPDLPEHLKKAVADAVLSFHDDSWGTEKGFVSAKDEDYNFIRKLQQYEKRLAARRQ